MEEINQPSQVPQPVNPTPPIVNPSKSKVIPIILCIVTVIIIAIGAYVLGTKQSQPVVQNSVQPTPTPSPTPIDETVNWKTYTDPTYNYSLNYPSDWSLLGTPNVAFSSADSQTTTGGTTIRGGKIVILVSNYKAFSVNLITDKSLTEFYKNVYSNKSQTDFVVIDRKDISISNILALRYVAEAPGTDDGTMTGAMVVYGNNVYQIEANYGRKDKLKTLEVFDQILSTFKFTP